LSNEESARTRQSLFTLQDFFFPDPDSLLDEYGQGDHRDERERVLAILDEAFGHASIWESGFDRESKAIG
jgi:hypothetical protein